MSLRGLTPHQSEAERPGGVAILPACQEPTIQVAADVGHNFRRAIAGTAAGR